MLKLKLPVFTFILLAILVSIASCSRKNVPNTRAVYMLMDTSGTYTKQLKQAQRIINFILSNLNPGDTFVVARVDTASFSEKNIIDSITFADRPSMANQQKREFKDKITRFVKNVRGSAHTDITGGMLQAIEYLNEVGAGHNLILIFSDLKEDLKKGYIRNIPLHLKGVSVVALNVTKLRSDNIDPRKYLNRLARWQKKVVSGGGRWKVVNDLARLESILKF